MDTTSFYFEIDNFGPERSSKDLKSEGNKKVNAIERINFKLNIIGEKNK